MKPISDLAMYICI